MYARQRPTWNSLDEIIEWVKNATWPPNRSDFHGLTKAMDTLKQYGSEAIDRVNDELENSDSKPLECVAIRVLPNVGNKREQHILTSLWLHYMGTQNPAFVQPWSVKVLKENRFFEELVALLREDRLIAIKMMGVLGDQRALPLLIHNLDIQKRRVLDILDQIDTHAMHPDQFYSLRSEAYDLLIEMQKVIEALGYIGGVEAVHALAEVIHTDMVRVPKILSKYDRMRFDAVSALGRINHPQAIVVLKSLLTDSKPGIRRKVRRLLKKQQA